MKKIMLIFIFMTSMMVLVACGNNNEDPIISEPPVDTDGNIIIQPATISFTWWGTSDRNIATNQAITLFESKYPQIKVEGSGNPWTGYDSTLTNQLNRDREADIFQINYNWIYSMYGESYFLDLNLLNLDLSEYPEDEHTPLTVNNKLLALSVSETGYIFYLNKKVYEDAGVVIPYDDLAQGKALTWDWLIAAGQQIGAQNPNKYAIGRLDPQQAAMLMFTYLAQTTGKNVINENDQLNFSQAELQIGFAFLNTLRNSNVILRSNKDDTSNAGPGNPNWNVYENYGGVMTWNTAISEYENTLPGSEEKMIAVGMFQQDEDDQLGMYKKVSMAYAVSKRVAQSSAKATAVKLFLEFMTTDPEAIAILGVDRGITSHQSAQATLASIDEGRFLNTLEWKGHSVVQTYYNHQVTLGQMLYIHPYYEHDSFRNVYELPIERFLLGDRTANQAISELMNSFNSQLQYFMR